MRVVVDARTATDHFPGIGRYVASLCQALVAAGTDLALLYDPAAAATRQALPAAPGLAFPVSPFALAQQWRVPAALHRLGADLYHSPYYLMPYAAGVPSVVTIYDLIPLFFGAGFTATRRLVYRAAHWLCLRRARVVLAISEATAADLVRCFGADRSRIAVTPLAAAPTFRPPAPAAVAALRERYGLPAAYVLYFGSNKPHKNLVRLVEAWAALCRDGSSAGATLVIAGQWDARYPQPRQEAEARGLGDAVRFLGPIAEADLPALYGGARLFVFPSLYEGFGLPVLEAMACGAAVVCSSTSSLPEVAGDAALMVDPRDVAALSAAMARVMSGEALAGDLRSRSLARAQAFSWSRTASATLAAYHTALPS